MKPSVRIRVTKQKLLKLLKLNIARIVLIDPLINSLGSHSICSHSQLLHHAVQIIRTEIEVACLVKLFKKFAEEQFVSRALGFLDEFKSQVFGRSFDQFLLGCVLFLGGVVPKIADESYENFIVSKVYVEIVVECYEFLFGNFVVDHSKE
jgi:hypothetical protein